MEKSYKMFETAKVSYDKAPDFIAYNNGLSALTAPPLKYASGPAYRNAVDKIEPVQAYDGTKSRVANPSKKETLFELAKRIAPREVA